MGAVCGGSRWKEGCKNKTQALTAIIMSGRNALAKGFCFFFDGTLEYNSRGTKRRSNENWLKTEVTVLVQAETIH